MKPSFRINQIPARPTAGDINRFADIPTPNISDALGKLFCAAVMLKPMHRQGKMIGPAFTVKLPPGDNLLAFKAIQSAEPGDVLVIDAGGVLEQAIVGEIMTAWAAQQGLAGMVIYGAIRDIEIVSQGDFPVYACGYTHRGPYRNGPGELNVSVSLGGMVVEPGDLMVGDANGVIAIPRNELHQVADAAIAIQQREEAMLAQIVDGSYDTGWIDIALRQSGYAI